MTWTFPPGMLDLGVSSDDDDDDDDDQGVLDDIDVLINSLLDEEDGF